MTPLYEKSGRGRLVKTATPPRNDYWCLLGLGMGRRLKSKEARVWDFYRVIKKFLNDYGDGYLVLHY